MLASEDCNLEDTFELLLGLPWRVDPSAKEHVKKEADSSLGALSDEEGDEDIVSSGSSIEYSSTEESEGEETGADESLFYLPVAKTETSKNQPLACH